MTALGHTSKLKLISTEVYGIVALTLHTLRGIKRLSHGIVTQPLLGSAKHPSLGHVTVYLGLPVELMCCDTSSDTACDWTHRSVTDVVPCCCDRDCIDNIQQELRPVAAQGYSAPQHAAHFGGHAAEPPCLCRL